MTRWHRLVCLIPCLVIIVIILGLGTTVEPSAVVIVQTIPLSCPEPIKCPFCPRASIPHVDPIQSLKWNGLTAISGQPLPWTEVCQYKEITSPRPKGHKFKMCLRAYVDVVSTVIKSMGRWKDCDQLLDLWDESPRAHPNVVANDPIGIFVDGGANIGACSLLMASQGHITVGFEPSSANFFYLTSGVMANREELRSKITLYRMGLGKKHTRVVANIARGNAGNTVLEAQVKDSPSQQFDTEAAIMVYPLDDVLWPDLSQPPPHIRVMKLDVQGYELKILQGSTRLLKAGAIGIIKSEFIAHWLEGQGTTPLELLELLDGFGYELIDADNKVIPIGEGTQDSEVILKYKPIGLVKRQT